MGPKGAPAPYHTCEGVLYCLPCVWRDSSAQHVGLVILQRNTRGRGLHWGTFVVEQSAMGHELAGVETHLLYTCHRLR